MKLDLKGKINRIYVQSLCMMFYHGAKFPVNEDNTDGLELILSTEERDGGVYCSAIMRDNGREAAFDSFCPFSEYDSEDRTYKVAIGQAIYRAGISLTGKEAKWGILTGIRPSKVVADILSIHNEDEAKAILTDKYLLDISKADLACTVAKNETDILERTDDGKCSIYISIPFCPSRCSYCSFISYAGKKLFSLIPSYLERLNKDIISTLDMVKDNGLKVCSIYIGGGTPTILDEEQLKTLLATVSSCIDVSSLEEFTLEGGRPDTITEKKLSIAKEYGITRISVNPQTLNDSVLEKIGRNHTVDEFLTAYEKVKNSGIKHINTDLIAGLDTDTFESFKASVDKIIKLDPDNVTVHSFCVKNASRIRSDDKDIYTKNDDIARRSVEYSIEALTKAGYIPYYMYRQKNTVDNLENVGYAKKGTFGLYNVYMMSDAHTVFGIGAGATTKLVRHIDGKTEILRIFSPKYPYEYLQEEKDEAQKIKNFFERS